MADHTKLNLVDDVKDMAPDHGMAPQMQVRFARTNLGMTQGGLSHYRLQPDFRMPFGHTHSEQEEVYVVLGGSLRVNIEGEIVELGELDAVRVPAGAWRGMESGGEGADIIAFGAPNTENADAEMKQGWWA